VELLDSVKHYMKKCLKDCGFLKYSKEGKFSVNEKYLRHMKENNKFILIYRGTIKNVKK
jgi:hypothetical protein